MRKVSGCGLRSGSFMRTQTRFASAMAGGGDYGVFANGQYQTTEQMNELLERLKLYKALERKPQHWFSI
jgi:hydroxylamine dehydrogenase